MLRMATIVPKSIEAIAVVPVKASLSISSCALLFRALFSFGLNHQVQTRVFSRELHGGGFLLSDARHPEEAKEATTSTASEEEEEVRPRLCAENAHADIHCGHDDDDDDESSHVGHNRSYLRRASAVASGLILRLAPSPSTAYGLPACLPRRRGWAVPAGRARSLIKIAKNSSSRGETGWKHRPR